MYTIAVGIQKGGVGKTSISVSLAAELAKNHKTLLLDLDIQGQASFWALGAEGGGPVNGELAQVLTKKKSFEEALCPAFREGLFCIPTYGGVGGLAEYAEGKALNDLFGIKMLTDKAASSGFEFCVIDLSPGFGSLERNAYIAADEVVTPIIPSPLSVDSLEIFAEAYAQLVSNMAPGRVKVAAYKKMIINALNRSLSYHRQFLESLKADAKMETFIIPVDQAFSRASSAHSGLEDAGAKAETIAAVENLAGRFENAD
jgi:chromosome partitioning protein